MKGIELPFSIVFVIIVTLIILVIVLFFAYKVFWRSAEKLGNYTELAPEVS